MVATVIPSMAGVVETTNIPIVTQHGSVATPLATISGSTGTTFTLPIVPTIPAGTIQPQSRVVIQASVKRTGANGTANLDCYLGTAGTTGDSRVERIAFAATTLQFITLYIIVSFGTSTTSCTSQGKLNINSAQTDNQFADLSTNINTAATMYVTLGTSSANAADSFDLIQYKVWVEPA